MEITRRTLPDGLELVVSGRLDAYWADHLANALDEEIRGGIARLALDLSQVVFLSSAGIRSLLVAHRELDRLGGALRVVRPSEAVQSMLEMVGLLDQLVLHPDEPAAVAVEGRAAELPGGGSLEVWKLPVPTTLRCRAIGDPQRLAAGYVEGDCHVETFPSDTFGLGLGAFGSDFADCRGRFGEFLAVGGAAAYLPTDGTNVTDFLIGTGALVPEVRLLYGLACTGEPSVHARFEARDERPLTVPELVETAFELAEADVVGMIALAETAGLVGAALRRSPASEDKPELGFPEVRRWLSFTSDRAFPSSQALVVGVAARSPEAAGALAPFLRPLDGDERCGHFHAAAFSFRPLARGPLELEPTVAGLFEREALLGLLHLVRDDRPVVGVGESELRRGALWVGPLTTTTD